MIDIRDPATLEQFAAGQLSIAAENEVLVQCEAEPELWRTALLAVLEHRQLASVLAELDIAEETHSPLAVNGSLPSHRPGKRRDAGRWNWAVAVAATLLLLAAGTGWGGYWLGHQRGHRAGSEWAGRRTEQRVQDAFGADDVLTPPGSQVVGPSGKLPGNGAARPVVVYVDMPSAVPAELPDASSHGQQLLASLRQPLLSEESHAILRDAGLRIEEQARLFVLPGENGVARLVPNREFRIQHVGYPVSAPR